MSASSAPTDKNNSPSESGDNQDDWRTKVQQSYRNAEVRQIAKVLAGLEPGASEASKLRLAMQFEDSIFRVGTSLADYHKRLKKRLKKVQKNYKPTVDATAATQEKERVIQELIGRYGDDVKYIVKHAETAVKEMRAKYGEDKAEQLRQHTDLVKAWARELGLLENTKPNYSMQDADLEKLKSHLEKRLENIRSHTIKLAEPDAFMLETLQKLENDFKDKGRAVRIQGENMQKRFEQLQRAGSASAATTTTDTATTANEPGRMLAQALDRVAQPVPILTTASAQAPTTTDNTHRQVQAPHRSSRAVVTTDDRTKAALIHLDRMRAASNLVLAYLCAPDKYGIARNMLTKAHDTATTGIDFVQEVMREHRKQQSQQTTSVKLHDAWIKPIVIPPKAAGGGGNDSLDDEKVPQQVEALVLRTRVLLTAGRKTPSNLLPALKVKDVKLVRPPPSGAGSHLKLHFEDAFVMTIYLVPLLVTLRASAVSPREKPKEEEQENDTNDKMEISQDDDDADDETTDEDLRCASWTPLHHGLPEREELTIVASVKGTYETVGKLVEERLRDASAHATRSLRTCFTNNLATLSKTAGDFEIELLEASALLEFIQHAQSTYLPS